MSEAFEPLENLSLRSLTKKELFLVALTTVKRVGEIQALSRVVSSIGSDLVVSHLPHFVVKTTRADASFPCSVCVRALCDFTGDLEEDSLVYGAERTRSAVAHASSLFVSSCSPSRPISKNAVSYFLWEVISDAGAVGRQRPLPESSRNLWCIHFCCVFAKLVGL